MRTTNCDDLTPEEDPDVEDAVIADVVLLLLATLSSVAPTDLCIDALLYIYTLKHNQQMFAGQIDRIVSIDDGYFAMVLLWASSFAFPDGNFGSDEWALASVPSICLAAKAFLDSRNEASVLSIKSQVDVGPS